MKFRRSALSKRTLALLLILPALPLLSQSHGPSPAQLPSRFAPGQPALPAEPPQYRQIQRHLAQGWNTWDVHSVATQVLLPEGLAIHVGLKHNTTLNSDAFLQNILIGRLTPGAEQVKPGLHSWNGSYTDLRISWKGHRWRIQSAHDIIHPDELVMLVTPLPPAPGQQPTTVLPPTVIFTVNFLWNRSGTVERQAGYIQVRSPSGSFPVYCSCQAKMAPRPGTSPEAVPEDQIIDLPIGGPYFAADLTHPIGLSTGRRRSLRDIEYVIRIQRERYLHAVAAYGQSAPIADAIQTTLGWDTIYEPTHRRVISPVSRLWSVSWGGYVLFDWDTFFASTMASIGDKDLAYADAIETLREETPQGFVPNYARAGGWKSFDRSEPPVGSITVLRLYNQYHDKWFLQAAYPALLSWNRWWNQHRRIDGYLTWGSDRQNSPGDLDDASRGTRQGAIYESGLDNSPMYDSALYNPKTHLLEYADVGLMSLYIADCDALAQIAETVGHNAEALRLLSRSAGYRAKLATLWDPGMGIFLNKDLHTGQFVTRLSPTNFYPMLARAATPEQVQIMVQRHLLNPKEFWGQWVIPSIARDDPAFHDQNYWRGRIWGPMNYLVYLGLSNYEIPKVRHEFAQKSYALFMREWTTKRHVHENYNAISGSGDDVKNSDRFYHWGALLGYIEYLELHRKQ
jgi:hypothetical protein